MMASAESIERKNGDTQNGDEHVQHPSNGSNVPKEVMGMVEKGVNTEQGVTVCMENGLAVSTPGCQFDTGLRIEENSVDAEEASAAVRDFIYNSVVPKSLGGKSEASQKPSYSHLRPMVNPTEEPKLDANEICLFVRFLKIGHVDTKNQRFVAHIEIIARWKPVYTALFRDFVSENRDKVLIPGVVDDVEQIRRILPKINVNNLEAIVSDRVYYKLKPEIALYPAGLKKATDVQYMEMFRSLKGVFFEYLELEDFPFDVQDICVRFSLDPSCAHYFKLRIPATGTPAGLLDDNTIFQDAQEWYLSRMAVNGENNVDEKAESQFCCSPHELVIRTNVRRKFTYHLYNCFLVMLFFAIMSYCNFVNDPENVQFRLAGGLTLVLTAVAYKLMLSNTLPTISYLTLVDKYVLIQIFMLTVLVVAFALLHLFYRSFKVTLDFTEDPVNCKTRIHFWNPRNSCELQAFANFSDILTMAIHASLQVFFNIYFCVVAFKKKKKNFKTLMQQEIDYKEFIKECPELREAMWNQNIVLPPMPNAQTTSMERSGYIDEAQNPAMKMLKFGHLNGGHPGDMGLLGGSLTNLLEHRIPNRSINWQTGVAPQLMAERTPYVNS